MLFLQAGGEERAQEPRETPVARLIEEKAFRKAMDFQAFFLDFQKFQAFFLDFPRILDFLDFGDFVWLV